jgi:hypothetical protein
MENQRNDALSNWRRELGRTLFYGTANVILSGITQGRMGLLPKPKVGERVAVPTRSAPVSVNRPVEYKEPDPLDHTYAIFGILRPPRR